MTGFDDLTGVKKRFKRGESFIIFLPLWRGIEGEDKTIIFLQHLQLQLSSQLSLPSI